MSAGRIAVLLIALAASAHAQVEGDPDFRGPLLPPGWTPPQVDANAENALTNMGVPKDKAEPGDELSSAPTVTSRTGDKVTFSNGDQSRRDPETGAWSVPGKPENSPGSVRTAPPSTARSQRAPSADVGALGYDIGRQVGATMGDEGGATATAGVGRADAATMAKINAEIASGEFRGDHVNNVNFATGRKGEAMKSLRAAAAQSGAAVQAAEARAQSADDGLTPEHGIRASANNR
jgi:hypothetical protein